MQEKQFVTLSVFNIENYI